MNKSMPFAKEEYQSRMDQLLAGVKATGLDAVLLCRQENIHYLTGFNTTGYWSFQSLIITADGRVRFIVRHFEALNADAYSWLESYRAYKDDEDPVSILADELTQLGLAYGKIGMEKANGFFFAIGNFQRLTELLPNMYIDDCSLLLERIRSVKSPAELVYVRKAAGMVSQAMKDGYMAVKEGVPEAAVAAAVYTSLLMNGSGFLANPPFIASGQKTGLGHATWGDKVIEDGDNVYFELVASCNRYHVPLMRTICVNKPHTTFAQKIAETSLAAVAAALDAIRPGATAHDVDKAARSTIHKLGMGEYFRHRTGYSVGVAYPPGWPEGGLLSLRPGNEEVLRPGMVLHLPLVLLGAELGGAGFSESVLVTEGGREVLTTVLREFKMV